ncbi:MAG: hypothetical protein ABSH44_18640 [Bryobacteraceae bacterium]|jgi:hypothetical protein
MTRAELLKKRNGKGQSDQLPYMTARDLARSGLAGMWKDRKDIRSTSEFARELRERLSRRSPL